MWGLFPNFVVYLFISWNSLQLGGLFLSKGSHIGKKPVNYVSTHKPEAGAYLGGGHWAMPPSLCRQDGIISL